MVLNYVLLAITAILSVTGIVEMVLRRSFRDSSLQLLGVRRVAFVL